MPTGVTLLIICSFGIVIASAVRALAPIKFIALNSIQCFIGIITGGTFTRLLTNSPIFVRYVTFNAACDFSHYDSIDALQFQYSFASGCLCINTRYAPRSSHKPNRNISFRQADISSAEYLGKSLIIDASHAPVSITHTISCTNSLSII